MEVSGQLYFLGNYLLYLLDRRLGRSKNRYGSCDEEKNVAALGLPSP
jgi:hypothetical protein